MRYLLVSILLTLQFCLKSQTDKFFGKDSIKFQMVDWTNFKYPKDISLGEAVDNDKIIYDTLTYLCNTTFYVDFVNFKFTFKFHTGEIYLAKIIYIEEELKNDYNFDVDFDGKIQNFLLTKNMGGEIAMFVRDRMSEGEFVKGYFTNKIIPIE